MGMDISSYSGVIANTKQMVDILKEDDLNYVMDVIYDPIYFANEENELEDCFKPLWVIVEKVYKAAGDPDDPHYPNLDEVKKEFTECVVVEDVGDEYEVPGQETLIEFWNEILSTRRPDLPTLNEIRAFSKSRLEGYDVPTGEACFIFGSYECFEKTLTKKGKALEEAIGHCDESEWTVVSC